MHSRIDLFLFLLQARTRRTKKVSVVAISGLYLEHLSNNSNKSIKWGMLNPRVKKSTRIMSIKLNKKLKVNNKKKEKENRRIAINIC